jgi:hypothetical protein
MTKVKGKASGDLNNEVGKFLEEWKETSSKCLEINSQNGQQEEASPYDHYETDFASVERELSEDVPKRDV